MANMAVRQSRARGAARRVAGQIAAEGFVGGGAGDHQAAGDGDQQRWDHGDQAIAHGEHGVGLEGVAEGNIELKDADQESGDDVDGGEQNGGERVPLAEAGGPSMAP